MRVEDSIEEKIAKLPNEGEVEGFASQLVKEGRMTKRLENLLALQREEIRRKKS